MKDLKMRNIGVKSEFTIKFLFVLISLLSMNKLFYKGFGAGYKVMTVAVILLMAVHLYQRRIYTSRMFMILGGILLGVNVLTALLNFRHALIGNGIEVVFMASYVFLMTYGYGEETILLLDRWIGRAVQIVSFISVMVSLGLLVYGNVIVIHGSDAKTMQLFGLFDGRLWGIVNPNAQAILCYIAVLYAVKMVRNNDWRLFAKINIGLQIIHFSIQQSRGALLSAAVIAILYFALVKRNEKPLLRIGKAVLFIVAMFLLNFAVIQLFNVYGNYLNERQKESPDMKTVQQHKMSSRLYETTSSGRFEIWSGALQMVKEHPVTGWGVRNVSPAYPKYFSKHVIDNSLTGGGFHNILITVTVNTGLVGLAAFVALLVYLAVSFLRYLFVGKERLPKMYMLMFFGLLTGQMFESQILYSTNFINIIFWFSTGVAVFYCEKERRSRLSEKNGREGEE